MKDLFILTLNALNKAVLPSLTKSGADVNRLSNLQKALLGYRYWVTTRYLEIRSQKDR